MSDRVERFFTKIPGLGKVPWFPYETESEYNARVELFVSEVEANMLYQKLIWLEFELNVVDYELRAVVSDKCDEARRAYYVKMRRISDLHNDPELQRYRATMFPNRGNNGVVTIINEDMAEVNLDDKDTRSVDSPRS